MKNAIKNAFHELEAAQIYFNEARGIEQIDEAAIKLTATEMKINRLIREIKRKEGLKLHKYTYIKTLQPINL
ncbi:MAG: hypothetical protein PHE29_01715 [Tissierellia bacterium]|nr:hypothetical protein [Tissierellia bacterium]